MSNKLVIVESPSKAKTIKKYLGSDYEVIASQGHIIDLPKSKFGIDVENDFKPEYITMKSKASIIKQIKSEAKSKENIYLATDPDREGEAIAWHLKNALKIKDSEKCRIEFNEITESAVKKAVKSARKIDQDLVDAQQARRILDRIVGYKLSPVLWKKIKKGLSAGRVQSVALKIIVDREKEIRSFVPEEYWLILVKLEKAGEKTTFVAKFYGNTKGKINLKNKEQVEEIVKKIDKKEYIVKDVKKSNRKKSPPPPFITSTLQQEASRRYNFPVKKTMGLAQKLYEAGYITYMRTDSTRISQDARDMAKKYIVDNFGEEYYSNRFYKTKQNAQDAHEAIRPTSLKDFPRIISGLQKDELKIYEIIFNRFLASQMAEAVYDTTKVTIQVEDYIFNANGSIIRFDGFMKLYIDTKEEEVKKENEEDEDESASVLPDLFVSDKLKQKALTSEQKFTQPPLRYTESSLVKFLEEQGIGRPSTYAPTISTIVDRQYVEKDKKFLVPTKLGEEVNTMMENHFNDIVNLKFTADMEAKLDDISVGKEKYVNMLRDFYMPFNDNLEKVLPNIERVVIEPEVSDIQCEKCGKMMVIKQSRFGKFLACPGYPECKNSKPIVVKIAEKCPKCGSDILVRKSKNKKTYYICENNKNTEDTCDYISYYKPSATNKKKNKDD